MQRAIFTVFISVFALKAMAQCTAQLNILQDGNIVTATLTGEGAATASYTINWGDGTFDFASSATHEFSADGSYNICGIYVDEVNPFSCFVQDCEQVVIDQISGSCTMTFDTFGTGMTVGVSVNGNGAANPGYSVNWGDGTSPSVGSDVAFHTYTEAGTYEVCVTYFDLNDEANCSVNSCQDVIVEESASSCTVEINVTVDGNTVTVTATGTGAEQPTYGIGWGDGSFPTLSNTGTHTYAQSGTYNVCVTYVDIANAQTCNATDCEEIVILNVEEFSTVFSGVLLKPNPVINVANVEVNMHKHSLVEVSLVDLTGKNVVPIFSGNISYGKHNIQWDASHLESGIYILNVRSDDEVHTLRMHKM